MSQQYILIDRTPSVCTITLNREDKRNAFCNAMSHEVMQAMEEAVATKCQALVIRAHATASVWSSGHDLSEISRLSDLVHDSMFQLFQKLLESPIPIICAVDGDVYAGGFLITLLSDIVIATERSRFCMTINKMGIPLPTYCYQFAMQVLGMHKAKEMFFTARLMAAEDVYANGLINHVVKNNSEMEETVHALVHEIGECNPEGVAHTKFIMNALTQHAPDSETKQKLDQRFQQLMDSPSIMKRVTLLLEKIGRHKS